MKTKKIISALSAAAVLVSAMPAAAHVTADSVDPSAFDSWQAAYKHLLEDGFAVNPDFDFGSKEGLESKFELYDVDKDGTPELFMSKGGIRPDTCLVYSFFNGKLSDPLEVGTYGNAFCDPNAHYVVHYDTHMGDLSLAYYKLDKGVFTLERSFFSNFLNEDATPHFYKMDGKEVSETEFTSEKEKYDHFELLAHGRANDISNVNDITEAINRYITPVYGTWQEAYSAQLRSLESTGKYSFNLKEDGSRYELYDVDGNGVPELFVSQSDARPYGCKIFTYNGSCNEILETGAYGYVDIAEGAPYIVYYDTHMGYTYEKYYRFDGTGATLENTFEDNSANSDIEEVYYKVNDIEVSKETYELAHEQYSGFKLKILGRKTAVNGLTYSDMGAVYRYAMDHYTLTGVEKDTKTLHIPDEINDLPVTTIGVEALRDCGLEEITFGKNITTVAADAFRGAKSLKTVDIGPSLQTIGSKAFINCPSLSSFISPNDTASLFCNDGIIYSDFMGTLVKYPTGKTDKKVVISKNVDTVLAQAFAYNENIEEIVFPENVDCIYNGAAALCPSLKSVTILDPEAIIDNPAYFGSSYTISNSFDGTTQEYVYSGVIKGYKGSTAEAYAAKYHLQFEALSDEPGLSTGDVDNNGAVNAVDASMILAEYALVSTNKAPQFNAAQTKAGDIDKNGAVNAVDASMVLTYYAYKATNPDSDLTLDEMLRMAL
ncbi:leucine-rich repeat protein [Ruminococcus flavefaciens]|uniref:leucine-rich repeat protein n=1 Tax=Ruminococcus flavefaciens TaxID=1265 RepID=UPI0026F2C52C|nr:leucine-rich repeat protein [Ruminococcus flavefaciens]